MKFKCIILSLAVFASVNATTPANQNLIDIQLEVSFLAAKKQLLLKMQAAEKLHEMDNEVNSVDKMISYRWGDFVSELKEAESSENQAQNDQNEIVEINRRLKLLILEAERQHWKQP